jgi:hypothetical protein
MARLALPPFPRERLWFLGLLLAGDLLFVLLHLLYLASPVLGYFGDSVFSLEKDRSFAEVFQYVKTYWLALLLVWLAWQRRHLGYAVWAGLFGFLLLDDAIMIHERVGEALGAQLALPGLGGVRGQDLGELIFLGAVAVFFALTLVPALVWGGTVFRRHSLLLAGIVVFLAAPGVGIDFLHMAVGRETALGTFLGMVEDGGEMVVMSVGLYLVLHLTVHAAAAKPVRAPVVHALPLT